MKDRILRLEAYILSLYPFGCAVRFCGWLFSRVFWILGRVRFEALVHNKGLGCTCPLDAELKYPENVSLGSNVVSIR